MWSTWSGETRQPIKPIETAAVQISLTLCSIMWADLQPMIPFYYHLRLKCRY